MGISDAPDGPARLPPPTGAISAAPPVPSSCGAEAAPAPDTGAAAAGGSGAGGSGSSGSPASRAADGRGPGSGVRYDMGTLIPSGDSPSGLAPTPLPRICG
jgi:hypothetical protein